MRNHRLHAGPRRSQGRDRGPRVQRHHGQGAGLAPGHHAAAHRGGARRAVRRACAVAPWHRLRSLPGQWRCAICLGAARRRVGCHCPELHQRHHRQPQGAWSTTTAAQPPTPSAMCWSGTCPSTRSTCGPCPCSTATAGVFRGRWRPARASTCCLRRVEAQAIFDAIRNHGVTHYCGAPSCTACWSTPRMR